MVFSSLPFLYFFLPAVLGLVALSPQRRRNGILLLASIFFFSWGEPRFIFALLGTSFLDYRLSLAIAKGRREQWRHLRSPGMLCAIGVLYNLGILGIFKYGPGLLLPLGISFFTFQKISYLVDVKRGVVEPAPTFFRYLLYILLFPQLILGPIIRYHVFEKQFDSPKATSEDFLAGLWRFSIGLGRKMLLASPLAAIADAAFMQTPGTLSAPCAWLGLYAYTMQLYYDFAGYSDMAVGLGTMLGFRFPENFTAPYISRNMAEFWRRWHMTLGAFMKEYLYIPLGGNRCSKARNLLNNWLVFIASGIWHGASWNFLLWGAWHGFWILIAKIRRSRLPETFSLRHIPAICTTFLLVMIGWIFFRAENFAQGLSYLKTLFSAAPAVTPEAAETFRSTLTAPRMTALAFASLFAFLPAICPAFMLCEWRLADDAPAGKVFARSLLTLTLLILSTLPLLSSGFNPFIYFRF